MFDAALAKPDGLADLIAKDQDEPCEFEEFGYVAVDVWERKTGKSLDAFPYTGGPPPADPAGQPFTEDEAHLAARYPRLWVRFGDEPLG